MADDAESGGVMPHEEVFDHAGSVPPITPQIPNDQRRAAMLAVAHRAVDVEDCARLLDMLGLKPEDALRKKAGT